MSSESAIRVQCTVAKVQTLADGGLRVVLDLPEYAIAEAAQLMATRREGVPLMATFTADTSAAIV